MQELPEHLAKAQLGTVALQEIRWSGTGLIQEKDYSLYYSCTVTKIGQAGTGFICMKKMQNYIIGFKSCNERLFKLRMKGRYNNTYLINAYAPTEDKTDGSKEQFYDDETNRNGEMCDFATANNLIMSTQCQHKFTKEPGRHLTK
jgi:hypothetical protein